MAPITLWVALGPWLIHQRGVAPYLWATGLAGLLLWWGLRDRRGTPVNLGMAGFALTVLVFYFSDVMDRLGRTVTAAAAIRALELRFPLPPAAVTEVFAASYGPSATALRMLDADGACRLRRALTRLWHDHNRAGDGTTTLVAEYLELVGRVR